MSVNLESPPNSRLLDADAGPPGDPGAAQARWYEAAKRALDVTMAVTMLVLALPLLLLTAVAVKLTSRGPVMYFQTRTGRNGRPYTIYKFRTMMHNCERRTGAQWSVPGDPRITPLGRFLRRSHIDEL